MVTYWKRAQKIRARWAEGVKNYENTFFERNQVLYFWPIPLTNPLISRRRSLKKKRHQIAYFLGPLQITAGRVAGRPAGRPVESNFDPKTRRRFNEKHAARATIKQTANENKQTKQTKK